MCVTVADTRDPSALIHMFEIRADATIPIRPFVPVEVPGPGAAHVIQVTLEIPSRQIFGVIAEPWNARYASTEV